ncbi:MAG: SDR family NAD(P)-dependent oxidoreductase [Candidatus Falkowbacteria bacterium]
MTKKTVLITGSRGGIGRDTAIALASLGYHVIATVHLEESVDALKDYAKEHNVSLEVFKLDITSATDRAKLLNLDIDVLINNAGVGESGSLTEVPMERMRLNFETNLFGTMELTQLVLKKMMQRDSGRIIFISSIAGRIAMPFWGSYCMTKHSLSVGADLMRQELKKIKSKIKISVVEPGTYHTGFNQRVMATKYTWMDEYSYFYKIIGKIKKEEEMTFKILERKTTKSIVNKIVQAVESGSPRLRYVAPWWQALFVRVSRILGK